MRRLASLKTRERVGWSSRLPRLHDFTFYASRDKKSDRKRLNYAANCTPARERENRPSFCHPAQTVNWQMIQALIWSEDALNWLLSVSAFILDVYAGGFWFGIYCARLLWQKLFNHHFSNQITLYDVFNETKCYPKHPVVRKSDFHQVWLSNWIWAYVFDAKPRKCLCEISIHILNQAK